jgi:hypothetical protein
MNEKKKEQEEKEKKREAEKRLRTQSAAQLPGIKPPIVQQKTLTPKELKEQQKKDKKEAEKKAKAEKEAAKKAKKRPPTDIEGKPLSPLHRVEADEVRIDVKLQMSIVLIC